ncbi:alpha/beta hydrolase [Parerythrobacter aurantius]|uniref:alpha/beta fold hydrolase n=1 Tax=Parerythrobacter aurantius TaxID=3127706 RepID=UPI003246DBC4
MAVFMLAGCAGSTVTSRFVPRTDPAVELLNDKVGETAFREGYLGSGPDRIHYVEGGEGPVILFVHGFPSFWYSWSNQLQAFRGCRRVIAIDAPGANFSGRSSFDDDYRIERLAKRLDDVIAELAAGEQITLVGHDWGGALAWSYAEWKPDRLDRLVVFSAPPHDLFLELAATDPEQQARSGYMQTFRDLDAEAVRVRAIGATLYETAYAPMVAKGVLTEAEGALFEKTLADPDAVSAGMAWYRANIPPFASINLARDAWPSAVAKARLPVLLVRGADDRTFVKSMGEYARAHADSLQIVTLPDVGHWTPFEDAEAANAALGHFLGLPDGRCPSEPTIGE